MTLIDERELLDEQEKKKKVVKLIIKIIIVLTIICILLLIFRSCAKKRAFKCKINGNERTNVSDNLLYKDNKGNIYVENGKVFISIRELSNVLNTELSKVSNKESSNVLEYQFYNSEYKRKGEDKTRCQVKVGNIYTSYIAYSNNIYRAIPDNTFEDEKNKQNTQNNDGFEDIEDEIKTEFEYFTVADKVMYINDELYASIEAIEIGFDVKVSYDEKNNTLIINTLSKLEEAAKEARNDTASSSEYSYKNKRLLKYGMTIVKNADGNLGIASYTDKEKNGAFVASCKYSQIDFNEATKTLTAVLSNDNKEGLLYLNVDTQQIEKDIKPQYEEIAEMTNNFDYFLIKQEGRYGVINSSGITILPAEFEEIGIKEENYSNLTCKYILDGKYIPVKKNGKWGLYNIEGIKLIEPQFEAVGCSLSQSGDSAVIISNMKDNVTGIVFLYNKEKSFYGIYNADTGDRIAVSLTEVYKKVENGEENYYMSHIIDRATSKAHTVNVRTEL